MHRKSERTPDLALPFEGELDPGNRRMKLAELILWDDVETDHF